jgi:hypothetical protein
MKKTFYTLLFFILLAIPMLTSFAQAPAAEYKPLVTIPGVTREGVAVAFPEYVKGAYRFTIAFSFVLAVIMLVIGGFQYMASEAVDTKKDAKNRIYSALFGVLIVITAYLLLNTINPDLLNFSLDTSLVPGQNQNTDPKVNNLPPCIQTPNEPEAPGWYLRVQKPCQRTGGNTTNITYLPNFTGGYGNTDQAGQQCRDQITDPVLQKCFHRGVTGRDDQPTFPGWYIKVEKGNGTAGITRLYFGPFVDPAGVEDGKTCRDAMAAAYQGYTTKQCIKITGNGEYCYFYVFIGTAGQRVCGFKDPGGANACKVALFEAQRQKIISAFKFDECRFNDAFGKGRYIYRYNDLGQLGQDFPTTDKVFNANSPDYIKCTVNRLSRIDSYHRLFTKNQCVVKTDEPNPTPSPSPSPTPTPQN